MLDVDASRAGAFEVADQLLERWQVLERVVAQHVEQRLSVLLEPCSGDLASVHDGVPREDHRPAHQRKFLALLASGSAMPFLIDSRIPGTASRCNVSWIACQSSAATRTALLCLPAM